MKRIKETPKHMVDYKHNLEQTLFKKKLGLEKLDSFQLTLLQANLDCKSIALPKLREKSFGQAQTSPKNSSIKLDKVPKNSMENLKDSPPFNIDITNPQGRKILKLNKITQGSLKSKFKSFN